MNILRVTAQWSGFPGAPGYSNFYFAGGGGLVSDAQQVADRVGEALRHLSTALPTTVTIRVAPEVEVLDSETGMVTGFHGITPEGGVIGSGAGAYSGPTGAVINWRTNDVRFGRRIRGRTFIVPLAGSSYQADGTLASDERQRLQDFADEMVGGDLDSELGVWSRPRDGAGGVFATVTSGNVPDMAAVLRSRRD